MTLRARSTAALLVLATATAVAEPPRIRVLAGVGARDAWGLEDYLMPYHPVDPGLHPALLGTITTPVSPHLALGVHAGLAKAIYDDGVRDCYGLISADLAVALEYVDPRFTVTAWIGKHVSRVRQIGLYGCGGEYDDTWREGITSYGVTATFDVFARASHHVAVFADAQTGTGGGHLAAYDYRSFNYSAVTLGLAYRR